MSAVAVKAGPAVSSVSAPQFGLIKLLKAGAAQLIVLHHLAFYGPMSAHVRPLLPELMDWLNSHARIAVQVFLVVGGFLAAKSLSPSAAPGMASPLPAIWRRYTKLAPPFIVATLLAAGASAWAAAWMAHDSISAPPTLSQLSAHALLLHGVLGYDAISAGAWYVAIDFQLYAAMVLLLWLPGRLAAGRALPWLMPLLVLACACASLFYFNLDSGWDNWAPYFFGSYGLGVLAWWSSDTARKPGAVALLLAMIVLPALAALILDFRLRIAVALAVACMLAMFGRARLAAEAAEGAEAAGEVGEVGEVGAAGAAGAAGDRRRGPGTVCATGAALAWQAVNGMAKTSYSVFLIHFPVCLVVNAAFTRYAPHDAPWQGAGMLAAWGASLAAGAAFFRWVETPLGMLAALAPWHGSGHARPAVAARPAIVPARASA